MDALYTSRDGAHRRRPYQQDAVRDPLEAFENGTRRQLCVLPTGAGKTIVAVDVIDAHGADEYAREAGAGALVNPHESWRREPSTARQLNALKKWNCPTRPGITKGEASDTLSIVIGLREGGRRSA